MLPLPYAPNIDVDAERLRMAREKGAQPAVDVGTGIAQGVQTGLSLKSALDADNAKAAAAAFQREYLDKGNEGIAKMYEEAGSPKDFQIGFYQIPAGTPADKARDMVLLAAKDLTGFRDKEKETTAATTLADEIEKEQGFDPVLVKGLRSGTVKVSDAVKTVSDVREKKKDRTLTADEKAADRESRGEIARVRAAATKAAAGIRRALVDAKDAGVVSAIQRENNRLEDIEADIAAAEADENMSASARRRLVDRLTREASGINTRISGYMTKVTDPTKIPPASIRKPEAGGTKGALDAATAKTYLQRAGGDANKAREMARKDGYTF